MFDVKSFTLLANQIMPVPMSGGFINVRSCTVASIGIGFDNLPIKICVPGEGYPSKEQFTMLRLQDVGGAGCTVTLVSSDDQPISTGGMTPAAANRWLAVATMNQVGVLSLAATGGAGTPILAANPNRRRVSVQAALTNAGTVYLGNAAANCSDTDCFAMLAPGQPCPEDYYSGAIYGVGSDALQKVVVYEL